MCVGGCRRTDAGLRFACEIPCLPPATLVSRPLLLHHHLLDPPEPPAPPRLQHLDLDAVAEAQEQRAGTALTPMATSEVTTATSASRSMPHASSSASIGSRAPRKVSPVPWYIIGSWYRNAGISALRALRTSSACER